MQSAANSSIGGFLVHRIPPQINRNNIFILIRRYRDRKDETPSHTGGVSGEYLKKVKDRHDKDRADRGVYASSKNKDKYDKQNKDRYDRGMIHIAHRF